MNPLSPKHSLAKKTDRVKAAYSLDQSKGRFLQADRLVDDIYELIAQSVPIGDIRKVAYERGLDHSSFQRYYKAALRRFAENLDIKHEEMRNVFYTRYELLLKEAFEKGDIYNARCILDSMSRIFGVEKQPELQIYGADVVRLKFGVTDDNAVEHENNDKEEEVDAEVIE